MTTEIRNCAKCNKPFPVDYKSNPPTLIHCGTCLLEEHTPVQHVWNPRYYAAAWKFIRMVCDAQPIIDEVIACLEGDQSEECATLTRLRDELTAQAVQVTASLKNYHKLGG